MSNYQLDTMDPAHTVKAPRAWTYELFTMNFDRRICYNELIRQTHTMNVTLHMVDDIQRDAKKLLVSWLVGKRLNETITKTITKTYPKIERVRVRGMPRKRSWWQAFKYWVIPAFIINRWPGLVKWDMPEWDQVILEEDVVVETQVTLEFEVPIIQFWKIGAFTFMGLDELNGHPLNMVMPVEAVDVLDHMGDAWEKDALARSSFVLEQNQAGRLHPGDIELASDLRIALHRIIELRAEMKVWKEVATKGDEA